MREAAGNSGDDRQVADWPDLGGRLAGNDHVLAIRIYFEDTDFVGIVYHANYLRYFERGRSDFLRLRGVNHTALLAGETGESLAFVVRHMDIDFVSPARIDEVIEIRTSVDSITGARLVLDQKAWRGADLLAATKVTIAILGSDSRPRRIPALVKQRLAG